MIAVGDLIFYRHTFWRALKADRMTRTVTVEDWSGREDEIANDLDETSQDCRRVCNPQQDWPFATSLPKDTPIADLHLYRQGVDRKLRPYVEWVPSDRLATGGSIFHHPELELKYGETLSARHEDGSRSQIPISRGFGTQKRRQAVYDAKNKKPRTAYDHLLAEDDYEE